ncbi:hypothetical protein MPH_05627 [Macrophomina phaseolina MS6]|uniref:AA1-like domain-containing protein n=1 Tax=Macrophomina phaseolina (strain MS6) TaxID=1126212 RepID=K2RR28_MACPH|nr:hypothetical protein MPH_05627 [Macrophomina phaseolina MS6]
MHASTFFASAAALVSVASAGTIPTFAKRFNVTEAWGQWQVTNLTFYDSPSSDSLSFQLWWDNGYSGPVQCSASLYSIQDDSWYRCAAREGYGDNLAFALSENWENISISQKLYQSGPRVNLNGTAPLPIKWENTIAGRQGAGDPFYVPVLSVSYTFGNGTTSPTEYSTRK